MSRKHNTRHDDRKLSHYPKRLRKRGVNTVQVRMLDLDTLRRLQGGRAVDLTEQW